jgi:hypothetical protein
MYVYKLYTGLVRKPEKNLNVARNFDRKDKSSALDLTALGVGKLD